MIANSVGLFNISPLSEAVDGEHFFLGGGGAQFLKYLAMGNDSGDIILYIFSGIGGNEINLAGSRIKTKKIRITETYSVDCNPR